MYKPNEYDTVEPKTFNEFEKPPVGGHVLIILEACEKQSKSGNQMLELSLDIAQGEFKGYYQDLTNKIGKSCYLKHYRLLTEDQVAYLKGDIKAIENSNNGFIYDFNENNLIGKLVGGNLREEEYAKDGDIKTSLKIVHLCSLSSLKELKSLPVKKFEGYKPNKQTNSGNNFSDGTPLPKDDDLPF